MLWNRWHAGTMSVGQEHLATEAIGAATQDQIRLMRPSNPGKTMLLACLAGEEHALPLQGVALGLAEWNIRSVVLGARTPPAAIQHAVAEVRPDIVGLSVTTTLLADEAQPLLVAYAAAGARRGSSAGSGRASARADRGVRRRRRPQ